MAADERFGPAEQTPAQRQALLDEAQAIGAAQGLPPLSPLGQRLYRRYVAGELSWPSAARSCGNATAQRNQGPADRPLVKGVVKEVLLPTAFFWKKNLIYGLFWPLEQ